MKIRPAIPGDEEGIACLHTHSWQSTYQGIIPDKALKSITVEDRRQHWYEALLEIERNPEQKVVFVIEDEGKIIGFISGGAARTDKLKNKEVFDAELYALYVENAYQGKGIGCDLFDTLMKWFVMHGYRHMFLWEFAENPYTRFYLKKGGEVGTEEYINKSLGVPLKIINFVWHDIGE